MSLTLTDQQLAIIAAVEAGETVRCEAVAGSAKTTTGKYAQANITKRRLNCAFNKRNALAFDKAMPPCADNKTFNAIGHGSAMKMLGGKLDLLFQYGGKQKTYQIMNELEIDKDEFPDFAKLTSLAKNAGLVPAGAPGTYSELQQDEFSNWQRMAENFDVDFGRYTEEEGIELVRKGLILSIHQCFKRVFDFDDQLYFSTLWGAPMESYGFVFIDEYQDLNPIQHKMAYRLTRGASVQTMMAGDVRQAIYAFRGAMADSADVLGEMFGAKMYPLTTCFRCAKSIVREAQPIVPEIQFWENSPEGEVRHFGLDWDHTTFQTGDTILCRNTKPLIPVFYSLIKQGVGARILGSEIGKGLKTILQKLLKTNGKFDASRAEIKGLVAEWGRAQYEKLKTKNSLKAAAKREQAEILEVILDRHQTARSAMQELDSMFSDDGGPVTLSTIHKAKGMEWDRVFLLDRFRIPSRFATQPWELQQEDNLLYVAITRAMKSLTYIDATEPF